MSSQVYPVAGGMEDWGYGAGWDNLKGSDATMDKCVPRTYPLEKSIDLSYEAQKSIKAMVFLVETD